MATKRRSPVGAAARAGKARSQRDGKSTIPCPACGTEYRIPVAMLDEQIQCASCKRVFVPASASRRRIQGRNSAMPFIAGGAVLVIAIAFGVIISNSGTAPEEVKSTLPEVVETGEKNPRVRDVREWVEALRAGNEFKLNQISDYPELGRFLGIGKSVSPTDMADAVAKELLEGERTTFMRTGEYTAGSVATADAKSATGTVSVSVSILDAKEQAKYLNPSATYDFHFRSADGRFRVVGWEVMYEPKLRDLTPKGPRPSKHAILGTAQDVERTVNGQKVTAREAELKPLPHLDGTTPEQQAEIDAAIAKLDDPEALPQEINRAVLRLKQIGKPAVPRLLNKLYEFTQRSIEETRLQVRGVTRALEDLTGQRFGFDPSSGVAGNLAKEEYRLSALKQWYGWWADNHWRPDFNYAIEKEEDLEPPPPKKDPAKDGDPK